MSDGGAGCLSLESFDPMVAEQDAALPVTRANVGAAVLLGCRRRTDRSRHVAGGAGALGGGGS